MTLIDNWWARWWRLWSTRLDAIEYAVLAYFLANPDELAKAVHFLPAGLQDFAAFCVPIILFAAKTGAKMTVQPKLKELSK